MIEGIEDFDVWSAADAGRGDDVGQPVEIDVAGRDAHAAGKCQVERHEALEHGTVGAAEDLDVRSAAGIGADDDVVETVAVHIARPRRSPRRGNSDRNAMNSRIRCPSVPSNTLMCGPPPRPGAGDDIGRAVAVDIADGHADAAVKRRRRRP